MSIIGFVAGVIVDKVVDDAKDVAAAVALDAAVDVAYKVAPRDSEGTSMLDVTTEGDIGQDCLFGETGAIVSAATGQIIHDKIHHNDGSDYTGGVADIVEDDVTHKESSEIVQHLSNSNIPKKSKRAIDLKSIKDNIKMPTMPSFSKMKKENESIDQTHGQVSSIPKYRVLSEDD